MPAYSFQLSAHLAGRAVSVVAAGSSTVVASGTLDASAKFVADLPVGDYVAAAGDGKYAYQAAGTVDQGDSDRLVDSALISALVPQGSISRNPALAVPVKPVQSLVTALQAGHGWVNTGSVAGANLNDTADFAIGTQSAKFSTVAAGSPSGTLDSPTLGTPIDMTGKALRLLVKVEGIANLGSLRFYASDATFANYVNYNLKLNETDPAVSYFKDGEWAWITLNSYHGSVTGTGARTAVTKFRLSAASAGSASSTIHLGAVAVVTVPTQFPNGVVSVCFDDGRLSPFNLARPKLDALGVSATAYPIREKMAGDGTASYMSVAQLRQLREMSGWEIGVHADTAAAHDAGFNTLTPAQVEAQLLAERQWLYDNNLGRGEGFAWPLGAFSKEVEDAAARVCAYGRLNTTASRETWPPSNIMRIRSQAVSPTSTQAQLRVMVDEAKSGKGWLCLTFHDLTTGTPGTLQWGKADFDSLMDYIVAAGVPILPVIDVIRRGGAIAP